MSHATDVDRLVRGVYGGIATFLYTWGMFLAVFASAGLIPSVLEPGRIELLLSKPVSRTHILLGRYVGNVLVVSCNIVYLVLGVWIILGIKTGIWSPLFLISIATTIFAFAVLLSVVILIGVLFESAALATMVAAALMVMSMILAQTNCHVAPAFFGMVATDLADALLCFAENLRPGQDDSGCHPEPDVRRIHAHLDFGAVRRGGAWVFPGDFCQAGFLMRPFWAAVLVSGFGGLPGEENRVDSHRSGARSADSRGYGVHRGRQHRCRCAKRRFIRSC